MVKAWKEQVVIPTYEVGEPEKIPIFLEKRVYQGSSGVVYPYPVIESIADEKHDKVWHAVYLENEYIKVMVLPELGGRVQMAYDKIKQRHFVYYNHVIKPAPSKPARTIASPTVWKPSSPCAMPCRPTRRMPVPPITWATSTTTSVSTTWPWRHGKRLPVWTRSSPPRGATSPSSTSTRRTTRTPPSPIWNAPSTSTRRMKLQSK